MTSERKDNHVALAMDQNRGVRGRNDFDDVELLHHALGGIDPAVVSLGTTVGGVCCGGRGPVEGSERRIRHGCSPCLVARLRR